MSSSSAVTKQPAKDVSQPAQQGMMESKEASASVSANVGQFWYMSEATPDRIIRMEAGDGQDTNVDGAPRRQDST